MRGSFLTTCSRMNRPIRNGSVPPVCDQMKRMSGQRNAVPALPKIRLAMVRVVSVANSIELGPTPLIKWLQQAGWTGWV